MQELRRELMRSRAEVRKAAGTGIGGCAGEGANAESPSIERLQARSPASRAGGTQLARLRERLRSSLSREAARHQVSEQCTAPTWQVHADMLATFLEMGGVAGSTCASKLHACHFAPTWLAPSTP